MGQEVSAVIIARYRSSMEEVLVCAIEMLLQLFLLC
jgi:hypothetical protein